MAGIDVELIKGLGMAKYRGAEQAREEMGKREQLGLMQEQTRQAPIRTKMMQQEVQLGQMAIDEKTRFRQFEEEVKNEWQANPDTDIYGIIDKAARKYGLPGELIEAYKQQNQLTEMATKTLLTIHKVYGPEKAMEFSAKDPILKNMGTPNIQTTEEGDRVMFDIPGLPGEARGKMGFVVSADGKIKPFKIETGKPLAEAKVEVQIGEKSMTAMATEMGKEVVKEYADVTKTAQNLPKLMELKGLLDKGMITGFGADWMVNAGKALQQIGFNINPEAIANTEAFAAQMGNQVGMIIKQFGAGTGLSDADREYAEKIVGGKITLTEKSIRKIIDMNVRGMQNVVKNYNIKAEKIMQKKGAEELPYDLRIDMQQYMPQGGGTTGKENLRQKYNY